MHSGEKSNKCNQCDYTSSHAGNLRAHLKTHSGEKPNKCNQCDFTSSYVSALKGHLKTHSGEKSNKCNQCDFACTNPSSLSQHLKTHSGEKSNKCNQCDFASSRAGYTKIPKNAGILFSKIPVSAFGSNPGIPQGPAAVVVLDQLFCKMYFK